MFRVQANSAVSSQAAARRAAAVKRGNKVATAATVTRSSDGNGMGRMQDVRCE
eukprot:CAMPEP_0115443236 /NCGR_PEP_ID=MMETSP0271-20121206/37763_1 /TAXON_ID=71861 /ORGANISM="Scrippsiella trochoidea, Strain CCMP3099" /LENGTH=52 /DNA_ID=CAMNT_0002869103 /DNA_START=524 /DNA_END=682 /DNA_ORIENTATION=-